MVQVSEQEWEDIQRLRAALIDFRDHGTRHDLHPTMRFQDWPAVYAYLKGMDDYVRRVAGEALSGERTPVEVVEAVDPEELELKEIQMASVLQDWVMELPLREQGTLLTAVRGCDLTPKYPLDSLERRLVGAIRAAFLNPADPREVDREPGCFFISRPPDPDEFKPSALGHYPWHWLSHVMHAMEVLGYRHPDPVRRAVWQSLYVKLVHSFHLTQETRGEMVARLSEDRIANGTVVS